MTNKHYLITGASSGLGRELALQLAKGGNGLTLVARRYELLCELKDEILKKSPQQKILLMSADVSEKDSVKKMVQESIAQFGALDCLIANAGRSMWSRFRDVDDPDELKSLMDLNYMGVVYSAFYALDHLRQSKGSFVAISSLQGAIPVPYHSGYVASKYAVNGFIETLRQEEPDIHFMLANPSWIAGTELRKKALASSSSNSIKVNTTHGKKVMDAKKCAEAVIKALEEKKLSVFLPKKYSLVPLLRCLAPALIDTIVKTKVDSQLR